MPPAARITDMHTCPMVTPGVPPVPHVGGPVISGEPTVIVAFMPQARISDKCTCVGPPDVIAKGSPTVLVGGMPAARLGDMTVHGGVITTGAPNVLIGEAGAGGAGGMSSATPGVIGAAGQGPDAVDRPAEVTAGDKPYELRKKRLGGDDNVDVMFAEAGGSANAGDGRATAQGEAALGMVRMDHAGHIKGPVGGSHKLQTFTADAKVYGSAGWTGIGGQAEASARMVEQEGSLFLGPDESNPYAEAGAGYSLVEGEAKAGALLGSDGQRRGVAVQAEAGFAAASGEIDGEFNIPIPFTDWTFSIGSKAKGSVGDVSVGGSAHAVQREDGLYSAGASGYLAAGAKAEMHGGKNKDTGRYHVGGALGGKFLGGIDLGLDFSLGPKYPDRSRRE